MQQIRQQDRGSLQVQLKLLGSFSCRKKTYDDLDILSGLFAALSIPGFDKLLYSVAG